MWNRLVALLTSLTLALGCGPTVMTPRLHEASRAPASGRSSQALKVHLRSGELVVLESWRLVGDGKTLEGKGTRYTVLREARETGPVSLAIEDVALLETSDRQTAGHAGGRGRHRADAVLRYGERHLSRRPQELLRILPDLLRRRRPGAAASRGVLGQHRQGPGGARRGPPPGRAPARGTPRSLDAQRGPGNPRGSAGPAVERAPAGGGPCFPTADGEFHPVQKMASPTTCHGPEGDCAREAARDDGLERRSVADREDLATREELELLVPRGAGAGRHRDPGPPGPPDHVPSTRPSPTWAAARANGSPVWRGAGRNGHGRCSGWAACWEASRSRWPARTAHGRPWGASTRRVPSRAIPR